MPGTSPGVRVTSGSPGTNFANFLEPSQLPALLNLFEFSLNFESLLLPLPYLAPVSVYVYAFLMKFLVLSLYFFTLKPSRA